MTARRVIDLVFAILGLALAGFDINQAHAQNKPWLYVLAAVLVGLAFYYGNRFITAGTRTPGT